MKIAMRGLAALCLAVAVSMAGAVGAQQQALESEREKVSYMVGMDVGQSVAPVGPDLDYAALERAIRIGLESGDPPLDEALVESTSQALMMRIGSRSGQPMPGLPPGSPPPDVDREHVGLLVGYDIGRSLQPIRDEIELPVMIRGLRARVEGGDLLLSEEEAGAVRSAFSERVQARMQAETAQQGERNRAEGEAFLARNRDENGVIATPSGLQYRVIRQGAGPRPSPSDRVRVNYHGTLLDGTVFDSSYDRGEPAEFGLSQVIPGWTEGVALMPVGARYRFWIPGQLAYGASGTPGGPIGPNATLVFDVELLDIL